jgi:hypothetical protein
MAGQVMTKLWWFAKAAGLEPAEVVPDAPDLSRFKNFIKAGREETQARYRRRKQGRSSGSAGGHP